MIIEFILVTRMNCNIPIPIFPFVMSPNKMNQISISISSSDYVCLKVYLYVCLCVPFSLNLCLSSFVSVCFYPSVCPSVCLPLFLSVCLSVCVFLTVCQGASLESFVLFIWKLKFTINIASAKQPQCNLIALHCGIERLLRMRICWNRTKIWNPKVET